MQPVALQVAADPADDSEMCGERCHVFFDRKWIQDHFCATSWLHYRFFVTDYQLQNPPAEEDNGEPKDLWAGMEANNEEDGDEQAEASEEQAQQEAAAA